MNKQKKPNSNGKTNSNGLDILPPDIEMMRIQVLRSEYRARLFKADFETAEYSIALDEIAPKYKALIDRQRKEIIEQQTRDNEILQEIKKNSPGEINVEEVTAETDLEGVIPIELLSPENIE